MQDEQSEGTVPVDLTGYARQMHQNIVDDERPTVKLRKGADARDARLEPPSSVDIDMD